MALASWPEVATTTVLVLLKVIAAAARHWATLTMVDQGLDDVAALGRDSADYVIVEVPTADRADPVDLHKDRTDQDPAEPDRRDAPSEQAVVRTGWYCENFADSHDPRGGMQRHNDEQELGRELPLQGQIGRLDSVCLLYTSPSPRDRG